MRRLLSRLGLVIVRTWTPRHRGLYLYRHRWAFAVSWWRTETHAHAD